MCKTSPVCPTAFWRLWASVLSAIWGGKVVRKPGPVINEIGARTEGERAHVEIHGRNLFRNAGVRIDTDDITLLRVLDPPTPDDKDTQTQEPDMYTVLRMDITNFSKTTDLAWQQSPHTLTVTNPDGQTATSWPFTFTSRENAERYAKPCGRALNTFRSGARGVDHAAWRSTGRRLT